MLICRGCCRIKSIIVGGGSMAMSPIRVSRCRRFDPPITASGCGERSNACGAKVGVWAAEVEKVATEDPAAGVLRRCTAVSPERQEMEWLTAGESWQESGLVFTMSVGIVWSREICPGLSSIWCTAQEAERNRERPQKEDRDLHRLRPRRCVASSLRTGSINAGPLAPLQLPDDAQHWRTDHP